jgi:hypothetical protein
MTATTHRIDAVATPGVTTVTRASLILSVDWGQGAALLFVVMTGYHRIPQVTATEMPRGGTATASKSTGKCATDKLERHDGAVLQSPPVPLDSHQRFSLLRGTRARGFLDGQHLKLAQLEILACRVHAGGRRTGRRTAGRAAGRGCLRSLQLAPDLDALANMR